MQWGLLVEFSYNPHSLLDSLLESFASCEIICPWVTSGCYNTLEILKGPWQEISIDIIGPLPKSNGMDAIVVIVDRFTKMVWLKATTMNISLEEIAKIYRDDIWKLHGISRKILSDRGLQFTSKFIKEFTKALKIKRQLLMAYHP